MLDPTETRRVAFTPGFRKYSVMFLAFCLLVPVLQFTVLPSDPASSETTALLVAAVAFLYFFKLNARMRKARPASSLVPGAK